MPNGTSVHRRRHAYATPKWPNQKRLLSRDTAYAQIQCFFHPVPEHGSFIAQRACIRGIFGDSCSAQDTTKGTFCSYLLPCTDRGRPPPRTGLLVTGLQYSGPRWPPSKRRALHRRRCGGPSSRPATAEILATGTPLQTDNLHCQLYCSDEHFTERKIQLIQNTTVSDMTPCALVHRDYCFGAICCLHLQTGRRQPIAMKHFSPSNYWRQRVATFPPPHPKYSRRHPQSMFLRLLFTHGQPGPNTYESALN
jgi:hypothetical protein